MLDALLLRNGERTVKSTLNRTYVLFACIVLFFIDLSATPYNVNIPAALWGQELRWALCDGQCDPVYWSRVRANFHE
jgi:hypothetical protein